MPNRAQRKHRREVERRQKQREMQRNEATVPWKRIADGGGTLRVWMNSDWRQAGRASIYAMRTIDGTNIVARFLVDRGVMGLKDAWERHPVTMSELQDQLDSMQDTGIVMEPVDAATALSLVRGAIRFAHDNGFRLPKDYEKVTRVLGDIGDWKNAEVSDFFIMEFAGSMEELQKRLMNQPVDDFLAREDVAIVLKDGLASLLDHEELLEGLEDGAFDEETADEVNKLIEENLIEEVRQRCQSRNEVPSPLLERGVSVYLEIIAEMLVEGSFQEGGANEGQAQQRFNLLLDAAVLAEPPEDRQAMRGAVEQCVRCIGDQ